MKLPKNLAKRYVGMKQSASMEGDVVAASIIAKHGAKLKGSVKKSRPSVSKAAPTTSGRPPIVKWMDGGLAFKLPPGQAKISPDAMHFDIGKMLGKRYEKSTATRETEFERQEKPLLVKKATKIAKKGASLKPKATAKAAPSPAKAAKAVKQAKVAKKAAKDAVKKAVVAKQVAKEAADKAVVAGKAAVKAAVAGGSKTEAKKAVVAAKVAKKVAKSAAKTAIVAGKAAKEAGKSAKKTEVKAKKTLSEWGYSGYDGYEFFGYGEGEGGGSSIFGTVIKCALCLAVGGAIGFFVGKGS